MLRLSLIDTLVAVSHGTYGAAPVSTESPIQINSIKALEPWIKPLQTWPKLVAQVIDWSNPSDQKHASTFSFPVTEPQTPAASISSDEAANLDGDRLLINDMLLAFQDEGLSKIKRRILAVALGIRLLANVSSVSSALGIAVINSKLGKGGKYSHRHQEVNTCFALSFLQPQ